MLRRSSAWLYSYYILLLFLLYLPIGILFLFSINEGSILSFPLRGLTARWYLEVFDNRELLGSVRSSFLVGAISSSLATALGTSAAIALTRFRFRGKALFAVVALMPLLIPFLILGVSLLILFSALNVPRSLFTVSAAHTVVGLPYALLIMLARMVGFDRNLEEAAQDLGASYWQTLRRIVLPLIAPAMLAAWLTAFTVSFDEFVLASFLVGGEPTFPVYLFGQLRFAQKFPQVVALAVLVMLGSLGLILIAERLQRLGTIAAGVQRARIGRERAETARTAGAE